MQKRKKELYEKAINNLKEASKRQFAIIKKQQAQINKLNRENVGLARELRIATNKYTKLLEEVRGKDKWIKRKRN